MHPSTNTSLSMIDCGVKSLNDLPLKANLLSINLHSNFILKIENLSLLQFLTHLDLSSNKISHIQGLNGLVSLRSLNLSCNQITSIQNLDFLKNLTWLNLSFNRIQNTSGLNDVWGSDYSLETLLLHSNLISSLEEISYYLSGLKRLKHLTLYQNRLAANYKPLLMTSVKTLLSLDGKDKNNKPVKYDIKQLTDPAFNEYKEFIEWSSNEDTKVNTNKFDQVLNKKYPLIKNRKNAKKDEVDEVPKLDTIEEKIHQLLKIRDTMKKTPSNAVESSDEDSDSSSKSMSRMSRNKPHTGILKSKSNHARQSISNECLTNKTSQSLSEFFNIMQAQINSYKQTQESNTKLIGEMKENLETLTHEKAKIILDKDEIIKKIGESYSASNRRVEELEKQNETLEKKNVDLNLQLETFNKKEENLKDNLEKIKTKIKKFYQNESDKQLSTTQEREKQHLSKIECLEKSYKSLEDEFRSALVIESNRYDELFSKYDSMNNDYVELKNKFDLVLQSDQRNKALIQELNELIREQKSRLSSLAKLRKDTTDDMHKHSEKLSEAVNDCVKLKAQLEQAKREKKELENRFQKFMLEYRDIKEEKESWNKKMADQKIFLMQENNRLDIETRTLSAELEMLKKNLNKDEDSIKIKSKIIEDQTETIKKLKSGVVERDDLLKKAREESLNVQKSLEQQLNSEMDLTNELQVKFEKANERKESIKLELEDMRHTYEETKLAYDELAERWKQKSELITELDTKVRKMKEGFQTKENEILNEKNLLAKENSLLNERLRKIDDEFRHQYDVEKKEHFKIVERVKHDYEQKLIECDKKLKETEEEMRIILVESAEKKKAYEEKIKSFSAMFSKLQTDLIVE
jgi:hypothetical protein